MDAKLADDLVAAMAALPMGPMMAKRRFAAAVERTLAPHGGLLLEGFALAAPAAWRSAGIAFPGRPPVPGGGR